MGNKKAKSSTRSKADAFDSQKPQGQVEPGKYEAVLIEAVLQDEDEKGQSARVSYMIATKGDQRGNKLTQWYKLFDENGEAAKGGGFLKRDLAILGQEDVAFDDLEECFEQLAEDKPGVMITAKQNGQYTNVYLNGICEEDVIDEFKDTNPF